MVRQHLLCRLSAFRRFHRTILVSEDTKCTNEAGASPHFSFPSNPRAPLSSFGWIVHSSVDNIALYPGLSIPQHLPIAVLPFRGLHDTILYTLQYGPLSTSSFCFPPLSIDPAIWPSLGCHTFAALFNCTSRWTCSFLEQLEQFPFRMLHPNAGPPAMLKNKCLHIWSITPSKVDLSSRFVAARPSPLSQSSSHPNVSYPFHQGPLVRLWCSLISTQTGLVRTACQPRTPAEFSKRIAQEAIYKTRNALFSCIANYTLVSNVIKDFSINGKDYDCCYSQTVPYQGW